MYLSPNDDLPVFVRYGDGRADILAKPDSETVAYSDFMVSGVAILTANGKPRDTSFSRWLRPRDVIHRIAIGLYPDGNVMVAFGVTGIESLKALFCSYGVDVSMLLASGDVYFNNPREGIAHGDLPVLSLRSEAYEEVSRPLIVIDPAHGGTDVGSVSAGMPPEKDLTLPMAVAMRGYLSENFTGTFVLTREDDSMVPVVKRAALANSLQADFVYSIHCNTFDSITQGLEIQHAYGASTNVKKTMAELSTSLMEKLSPFGVVDQGVRGTLLDRFNLFEAPLAVVQMLYMDNERDALLLNSLDMLAVLGRIQAESLAKVLGLPRKVSKTFGSTLPPPKKYRVNVGQYSYKFGAQELCDTLRKQGIDAWITKENP